MSPWRGAVPHRDHGMGAESYLFFFFTPSDLLYELMLLLRNYVNAVLPRMNLEFYDSDCTEY